MPSCEELSFLFEGVMLQCKHELALYKCYARKAMNASMLTQTYAIQLSRVGDGVMVDQNMHTCPNTLFLYL